MQPAATVVQVCPCLLLHVPLASQVPAQRPFGLLALFTATQEWLLVSHVVQAAVQSLLAQQPFIGMQTVVPPMVQDLVLPVHE